MTKNLLIFLILFIGVSLLGQKIKYLKNELNTCEAFENQCQSSLFKCDIAYEAGYEKGFDDAKNYPEE